MRSMMVRKSIMYNNKYRLNSSHLESGNLELSMLEYGLSTSFEGSWKQKNNFWSQEEDKDKVLYVNWGLNIECYEDVDADGNETGVIGKELCGIKWAIQSE